MLVICKGSPLFRPMPYDNPTCSLYILSDQTCDGYLIFPRSGSTPPPFLSNISIRYCDVPGSPCLSKKGESSIYSSFLLNFLLSRWLSGLSIVKCVMCIRPLTTSAVGLVCGRTKGSLAPCLVAAQAVCWRPRLAGTRQYIR